MLDNFVCLLQDVVCNSIAGGLDAEAGDGGLEIKGGETRKEPEAGSLNI